MAPLRASSRTLTFRAYGVPVTIELPSREAVAKVRAVLPPGSVLLPAGGAATRFAIARKAQGSGAAGSARFQVTAPRQDPITAPDLDEAVLVLEGLVRLHVAARAPRRVFIHAGAVAWQGRAVVLPGRTLAGKSTLVKALIGLGAEYLSDEYAVLDARGRVHPYARPLGIRPAGSLRAQPVMPEHLGARVAQGPLPIALVVAARYEAGATWACQPLTRGATALALLDNAVSIRASSRRVLPAVGAALAEARGFAAVRGEADEAARAILALASG